LDSPRVQLIRRLFDLMESTDVAHALEELLANCTDDVYSSLTRPAAG